MRILGIVAEYNPFHNGHLYQLNKAKELSHPDATICVMSGNFIQRGEPALLNKFSRADIAIANGIDLVIELPTYYALSTAEKFAYNGVKLLNNCGVTDISFGCECEDIELLKSIATLLVNEPNDFKTELKRNLDLGLSFPEARENSIKFCLAVPEGILSGSNNILAIEYLKAITKINSKINVIPIKRIGADYASTEESENIMSATGIREELFNIKPIDSFVSSSSLTILNNEISEGKAPIFINNFERELLLSLRKLNIDQLKDLPEVTEGLENRLQKAISESTSVSKLIDKIKTKRYPLTRIKRILLSALLNLSKARLAEFDKNGGAQYIRILAINNSKKELLSRISSTSDLPIVTSLAKFIATSSSLQKEMLDSDILSTNIYSLAYKNQTSTFNEDYHRKLI